MLLKHVRFDAQGKAVGFSLYPFTDGAVHVNPTAEPRGVIVAIERKENAISHLFTADDAELNTFFVMDAGGNNIDSWSPHAYLPPL